MDPLSSFESACGSTGGANEPGLRLKAQDLLWRGCWHSVYLATLQSLEKTNVAVTSTLADLEVGDSMR